MKKKWMALLVVLYLAAGAAATRAQILTGTIIGTVTDESGAVLPGVLATLSGPTLPADGVSVVTNASGEYRFTELKPSTYVLTLGLDGFQSYSEEGLRVLVSTTIDRSVSLQLGTLVETITVTGESPVVDVRQVGVRANLVNEIIEVIPTRRFGYYEYVKWAPGAAPSTDASSTSGSVSVLGGGTNENIFLYEGVNGNSPASGSSYSGGLNNAVEEVSISTLGASAEYQVAQGAVFSAVLKSGTNQNHGDVMGFFYPNGLISKPIKLPCGCPDVETGYNITRRLDYSATFGGPLKEDRAWIFGAWIYTNRKERNPGVDPDLPFAAWNNASVAKVTYQITDRVRVHGMFQIKPWFFPSQPDASRPIEATPAFGGNNLMYSEEVNFTLRNDTLVSARVTGWIGGGPSGPNFRTALDENIVAPRRHDSLTGNDCCGVDRIGDAPLGTHNQMVKVNSYIQGARVSHDLRFGVQIGWKSMANLETIPFGIKFDDFGGLPDEATTRNPYVSGALSRSQGVWAEDQVTIGNRLTVNLGLRYDRMRAVSPNLPAIDALLERTGATVTGLGTMFTWNAVSPRLGWNARLTDDGKTILRGSYGRAYRVILLNDFNNVHPGLSPTTLRQWDPATMDYTTILSVTDPLANLGVDPNSDAPFTDTASIGVDRELMPNLGISATYVYKYGQNHIGWNDVGGVYGTGTAVLADGRIVPTMPLLNTTAERLFMRTNGPGTFNRYHGGVFTLDKRMSNNWQATASYTFSKSEGLTTTQKDPNRNINGAGRLATDRPHLFSGIVSAMLPWDTQVSANMLAMSGTPFAPQASVTLPQGRQTINIEPADGTFRLPAQRLLFLRFYKNLFRQGSRRFELMAELSNAIQDEAHVRVRSTNFFSSNFNVPRTWVLPRLLYFSAALKF